MAVPTLLRLVLAAGVLLLACAAPSEAGSIAGGPAVTSLATLQRMSYEVGEQVRLASTRLAGLSPLDAEARGGVLRDSLEDIIKLIIQFIEMLWEPLALGDYAFAFDTDSAKGNLSLKGLSLDHLRDMVVDGVDIDAAALCAEADLRFPLLTIRTKYDLDVSLSMDLQDGTDGDGDGASSAFRIFGKDRAKIDFENITLHTDVCATVNEVSITVSNMRLSVDKDKVNIWGLFGGGKISDLISGIASDMVPELVKDFQTEVTEFLTNYINDFIKSKLPASSTTALPTP